MQAALRIDLGDHFSFDITRVSPLQEEAKGARVHVRARLGPTRFATFHIDVVVATAMIGIPDVVGPLTPLEIEGLVRPATSAPPLAPIHRVASQRAAGVKDLVDIAIIATAQAIDSKALRTAVVTNAALRSLELPRRFAVPDPAGWAARYPRVAAEAPGPVQDYDTAVILAGQIFDPILDATVAGTWDPTAQAWVTTR